MRLFPPALEVGDLEGFTPETDIFGRKKLAAGLTNLVGSISDPTVMALDGQWGSGKTAFFRMWAGELRKQGFPVVYFDAFENDFADDAFIALASQVIGLLEEQKKLKTPKAKKFVLHAKEASKILLRSGVRLGIKVATLNALDTKEFEDSASAVADELSGMFDEHVGERLTSHRQDVKSFDAFRSALSELPILLQPEGGEKPLIIMIDELDRCRPVYALELLERIKHFFSVDGTHFVLGVHLEQLENSVIAAYGANIDAKMYLQKFVQLVVSLADVSNEVRGSLASKYVSHLRTEIEFKPKDQETAHYASEVIVRIARARGLSLRSIERAMGYLALGLAFTGQNALRPAPIVAGLAVIKATDMALFRKAKEGTITYEEVETALSLPQRTGDEARDSFEVKWWRFCVDTTITPEFKQEMTRSLHQYNIWGDSEGLIKLFANEIMDRLE